MAPRWYAARTKPRSEIVAAEELGRDGFEVFFPRVITPAPRIGQIDAPLFPGYLFLHCDLEGGRWPSFRQTHHILGWVSFEGKVPSLPDEVISELRERSESINREGGLWRRFRKGDKVRVASSSVEGFAEIIEEAKSPQSKAKVLMQFMGRLVQAQVPWENLQPVEDQPGDYSSQVNRPPRRTRGRSRWIRGFEPTTALLT